MTSKYDSIHQQYESVGFVFVCWMIQVDFQFFRKSGDSETKNHKNNIENEGFGELGVPKAIRLRMSEYPSHHSGSNKHKISQIRWISVENDKF